MILIQVLTRYRVEKKAGLYAAYVCISNSVKNANKHDLADDNYLDDFMKKDEGDCV